MTAPLNLVGRQFGRLLVEDRLPNDRFGKSQWLCLCSCGNTTTVVGSNLIKGKSGSCGCLFRERLALRSSTLRTTQLPLGDSIRTANQSAEFPMTGQSLITTMAAKYSMNPVQFAKTVRATAMPSKHTEEQFAAFMLVAHQYNLNPILREVFAFPTRSGGIAPVVSVDGWVNLVNSHPQFNGMNFTYEDDEEGNPISCTCSLWRKDRDHPTVITEYYREAYRNTEPWNTMPRRMLRHKALKECARYTFGLSGIHDQDEARDLGETVQTIEHEIPPADLDAFAAAPVVQRETDISTPVESVEDGGDNAQAAAAAGRDDDMFPGDIPSKGNPEAYRKASGAE